MTAATRALRRVLVSAWTGAAAVDALVGGRIVDRVPADLAFPYVAFGATQRLPDAADGLESSVEIYQTVHVWSRAVGAPEAFDIGEALIAALPSVPTAPADGWSVVDLVCRSYEVSPDPDGLTTHGVMTLRAWLDPA